MPKRITGRLSLILLSLFLFLLVALSCLERGARLGRIYETNRVLLELPRRENLSLSLREVLGLTRFYSQTYQDRWTAYAVFPGVRDGFYVEVGSGDGVTNSNSKFLDELGWKGVCVDPFPTNMENRTCQMFKEVVSGRTGLRVQFRAAGGLGGIHDNLGRCKENETVRNAPLVEFKTVTLDDILERAKAPKFIHYMSIDIEGAEYEALNGLSFDKYQVGAFTIEHNYEVPKRTQIQGLLESKGYRLVRTVFQDDWYVRKDLAQKLKTIIKWEEISTKCPQQ